MSRENEKQKNGLKLRIAVSAVLTAVVVLGKYLPYEDFDDVRKAVYYSVKKNFGTADMTKFISDIPGKLK